jgi:hypothetical protein
MCTGFTSLLIDNHLCPRLSEAALPLCPGMREKRSHEHIRYGNATTPCAALEAATGKVTRCPLPFGSDLIAAVETLIDDCMTAATYLSAPRTTEILPLPLR